MEFFQNTSFLILLNLLGVLALIFRYFYFGNEEKFKLKRFATLFPGPKTFLYFGNSLDFILHPENISKKLYEYAEKYGPRYRLWIGKKLYIVLSNVEDVEEVLRGNKFLNKGDNFHEIFGRIFGKGSLTAEDTTFRKSRKIIQHPLKANVVETYFDVINDETNKIMKKMEPLAKSRQTFEILDYVGIITFNVVSKSLYDLNDDVPKDEIMIFKQKAGGYLADCFNLMFRPKLIRKLTTILTKKAFQEMTDVVSLFYKKVVMENKINQKLDDEEIGDEMNKKFIHYMQDSTFSDEEKKDEIITFSVGGTETVSITISFTFLMLAMHTEIQEKVYNELHDIFGNSDRDPTGDDLRKIIYLEQVIKEVMRLYPVVPFMFRSASEPTTFRKHSLPGGTLMIVNILGLHKNPNYFLEPETFDPERFSGENFQNLPNGCYLPFGMGLRNCIGKAFAMYEMKIICSSILRKYQIHTTTKKEDIRMTHSFVSTNANGFKVSITERDRV